MESLKVLQNREETNELRNRIILLLLEKSVSFFFIYIMEFGKTYKENQVIKDFFNDFTIQTLLTGAIRNIKLDLLEKEYNERFKNEVDQEYYIVKPWKKNIA